VLALAALLASHAFAAAPPAALDSNFSWSADVLNSDFRNETLDLSGNVRVKQGPMSIQAGSARGRDLRASTSRWTFEKAVHIQSDEADLQSNSASAAVVNGQITEARVEGTPARFEQRGAPDGQQVRGRAGVIEYDISKSIVTLSNQVWFSNGKDEFRGDVVIYNVRDERVQINPGGSAGRVRGVIRPKQTGNKVQGQQNRGADADEPRLPEESPEKPQEHLATDGVGA
jgi:lipopolysaccharide transport protein LptA